VGKKRDSVLNYSNLTEVCFSVLNGN